LKLSVFRGETTVRRVLLGILALLIAPLSAADPDHETMQIVRDADIVWKDTPGVPGVKSAVIQGDPSAPGLYIVRVRFAPGVMSPPHFHPETRYIAVLKGTWWVGAGPKWDRQATTPVPAGSFVVHHPNKIHYDGAKDEEVTLQISGIGPSGTKLVDESGKPK
jgi:quercetin dioxygenase-like cupin family protein